VAAMNQGSDWAINHYGISVVPSLGLLDQRVKLLKNQTVLAMGSDRIAGQEPLPAVPLELEAIKQQFGGQTGLLNQQFTYNGILQALRLRQPGILHLATHAEFNEGSPEQSLIYLWDRSLHLKEIRNLNLEALAPELLVLSACNTATGNPEAELGFTGLAALSGVKTAMGSLWQVSDLGTLALMSEFYAQLRMQPSRTDALRAAQAGLRDGLVRIEGDRLITSQGVVPLPKGLAIKGTRLFSHPYYWSGFTMVGNPW
jgi:CHAT domain-containing protein